MEEIREKFGKYGRIHGEILKIWENSWRNMENMREFRGKYGKHERNQKNITKETI